MKHTPTMHKYFAEVEPQEGDYLLTIDTNGINRYFYFEDGEWRSIEYTNTEMYGNAVGLYLNMLKRERAAAAKIAADGDWCWRWQDMQDEAQRTSDAQYGWL